MNVYERDKSLNIIVKVTLNGCNDDKRMYNLYENDRMSENCIPLNNLAVLALHFKTQMFLVVTYPDVTLEGTFK